MGSRRGLLGGLAALGIGRSAAVGAVAVAECGPPAAAFPRGSFGSLGGVVGLPMDEAKHRQWRELLDAAWARRHRLEARLQLTGGVPPGIASNRSWRPWFQVMAVDRWREEHLPHPSVVERAIHHAVFGRDGGG